MRENLKKEIRSLVDKYLEVDLVNAYKKILVDAEKDPAMVKLLEQTELSLLYSSILQDAEQKITEALKKDGIRWVADVWIEIESRLEMPEFSYCDISASSSQRQEKNIREIEARINAEKMDFARRAVLPSVSSVLGIGTLLKKPKVMGAKTLGVTFLLVGGALFVKLYQEEKERSHMDVKKMKPASRSADHVSLKEVLKAQYVENKDILREWFRTMEKYAGDAQEEQIRKESEE